jgi:hypothetical protein
LLARVLELEQETALSAADPQQTWATAPMLDAVVPQLCRCHDGGLRVVNARRSREIAYRLPQRADSVKVRERYVDHRHLSW